MRYHLWFARSSRKGPLGVRDSNAVTGATRPVPYCACLRFGRLLQGVFTANFLSPVAPKPGVLWAGLYTATSPFLRSGFTLAQFFSFVNGLN